MEQEKIQNLAAKIALLLNEDEKKAGDFSALRSSIEKINERLTNIEEKLETSNGVQHSAFNIQRSIHPSLEKFPNLENLADEIIHSFSNEKACPYEPTGKPCDHCAMCDSRGF